MRTKALLLVNRKARSGHALLANARRELRRLDVELIEESRAAPARFASLIRRYADRVDMVVVGGGDGTLNAAVAGVVDTQLPLAVLPLGTANDLARTLSIPEDVRSACVVAREGTLQRIDLGWVNGHYYFNVASIGLTVSITRRLRGDLKRRWGTLAYVAAAAGVVWNARPFSATVHAEEEALLLHTIQVVVGNGRFYGGGMTVAADAAIDDGWLDFYSLDLDHWSKILPLLPRLRKGEHADWPGVRTLRGQEFRITTDRPRSINTDGEITTHTPATFRLIRKAIPVIVPAGR